MARWKHTSPASRSIVVYTPESAPAFGDDWNVGLECIDPDAPKGRRWFIRSKDVQRNTGIVPFQVSPVRGLDERYGLIPLVVHGIDERKHSSQRFVFVDQRTATMKSMMPIMENADSANEGDLLLSKDGTRVAYLEDTKTLTDISRRRVHGTAVTVCHNCRLVILDVPSKRVRTQVDVSACASLYSRPLATDERPYQYLIYDWREVVGLSPNLKGPCKSLFVLDPGRMEE